MYPILTLKTGKEANVGFRHPWVFSGALEAIPKDVKHGDLVCVADRSERILGTGTYSKHSSIAVRVLEFGEVEINQAWFAAKIKEADGRRRLLGYGPNTDTTGYRVVFGEADGIPGLVVDRYGDVVVMQLATAGLDALREPITAALMEALAPRVIVERSDTSVRGEEELEEIVAIRHGEDPGPVDFLEQGLAFTANVMTGQKTGFFLDQKDLRQRVSRLASERRVLNLFSYTGATGIAAMKGGATHVHNVDSSENALEQCAKHAAAHGIAPEAFTTEQADAFQWLSAHGEARYDMVLLDPPALIKSKRDVEEGKKAYHFMNRAAMRLVEDGGLFVTSSCSHFMPEEDLAFLLRRASVQSGLHLNILSVIRQSPDHPLSIYFPESAYLKTFIFQVNRRPAQDQL